MTEYAIWKPEHDGQAPPNWREGMKWTRPTMPSVFNESGHPEWVGGYEYHVEPEALNSPDDDAEERMRDYAIKTLLQEGEDALKGLVRELREYPAEELAKHGITLAPEKDWATELWADLLKVADMQAWSVKVRKRSGDDYDQAAIELLRTRFEQMIAEMSKRDA